MVLKISPQCISSLSASTNFFFCLLYTFFNKFHASERCRIDILKSPFYPQKKIKHSQKICSFPQIFRPTCIHLTWRDTSTGGKSSLVTILILSLALMLKLLSWELSRILWFKYDMGTCSFCWCYPTCFTQANVQSSVNLFQSLPTRTQLQVHYCPKQ